MGVSQEILKCSFNFYSCKRKTNIVIKFSKSHLNGT